MLCLLVLADFIIYANLLVWLFYLIFGASHSYFSLHFFLLAGLVQCTFSMLLLGLGNFQFGIYFLFYLTFTKSLTSFRLFSYFYVEFCFLFFSNRATVLRCNFKFC